MGNCRSLVSMVLSGQRLLLLLLLSGTLLVDHYVSVWRAAWLLLRLLHSMGLVIYLHRRGWPLISIVGGLRVGSPRNVCRVDIIILGKLLPLRWVVLHWRIHVNGGVSVGLTARRHRVGVRLVTLLIRLSRGLVHLIHLLLWRAWSSPAPHLIRGHLLGLWHCWVRLALLASILRFHILTRMMSHLLLHVSHLPLGWRSQWSSVWFARVNGGAIFLVSLWFAVMIVRGTTTRNLPIHLSLKMTILSLVTLYAPRYWHVVLLWSTIAYWQILVSSWTFLSVHTDFLLSLLENISL